MSILKKIFLIPLTPFIAVIAVWILIKIYQNTNEIDIELQDQGEIELTIELKDWLKQVIAKNKILLNISCLLLWIIIISL